MNFKGKKKNKQQENTFAIIESKNRLFSRVVIALSIWCILIALVTAVSDHKLKDKGAQVPEESLASSTTTSELIMTAETLMSTSWNVTTTTTAKAAVTKIVTVPVTVTSNVQATERSVVTEMTVPVETEPEEVIQNEPVVEIIPEPEPEVKEIIEEPVYEEEDVIQEEPQPEPSSGQEYYSDDGDHGWSYVEYRYGVPDISKDRERHHAALDYVTEEERIYLINVVTSEYGSDYVPLYEKAKVVAVVMNRLHNGYWGDSISSVLSYPGQFVGYYLKDGYYGNTTPECIDAVDYYFLHKDDSMYNGIMYISGGGGWNSFY
jgi:hypothetical protein